MNGKDFEKTCLMRMEREEELGRAMMVRYGTQGSYRKGEPIDLLPFFKRITSAVSLDTIQNRPIASIEAEAVQAALNDLMRLARSEADGYQPIRSLPDFCGILAGSGRAFDIECKVCGSASLSLHDEKLKKRQLAYLLKRSRFGAVSILLIHFSERKLASRTDEPQTWAFPVAPDHDFWQAFERGEVKSISRSDCEEYAVLVPWNCLPGGRTPRPDILQAVYALAARKSALKAQPIRPTLAGVLAG